ncbi:MAG: hypothetical protein ACPGQL_00025 [Thermoplasmatota archaeon]
MNGQRLATPSLGHARRTGTPGRILEELADAEGVVAFSGLRRRLGVHPQQLTRHLRRLEAEEALERTEQGYRLVEQEGSEEAGLTRHERVDLELLRLRLLPGADAAALAEALEGRWFDGLRFYGRSDGPDEVRLTWVTEPEGRLVKLRLVAGLLLVESEAPDADLGGLLAAIAAAL